MKHYVKNLYQIAQADTPVVPDFAGQRERFTCPCCRQNIVIAVPPTAVDWERVANDYKRYANHVQQSVNLIGAELQEEFGFNPVHRHFEVKIRDMIRKLQEDMPNWE